MVRMTKAIVAEFYLEASWYAYAIIEDRLVAVLKRSGGVLDSDGNPVRMLGPKLKLIRKRRKKDILLQAYFPEAVLGNIDTWKEERNDLMHAMADASASLPEIDKRAYLMATRGQELVKSVCRHQRQLRNNRHQIPVPTP